MTQQGFDPSLSQTRGACLPPRLPARGLGTLLNGKAPSSHTPPSHRTMGDHSEDRVPGPPGACSSWGGVRLDDPVPAVWLSRLDAGPRALLSRSVSFSLMLGDTRGSLGCPWAGLLASECSALPGCVRGACGRAACRPGAPGRSRVTPWSHSCRRTLASGLGPPRRQAGSRGHGDGEHVLSRSAFSLPAPQRCF